MTGKSCCIVLGDVGDKRMARCEEGTADGVTEESAFGVDGMDVKRNARSMDVKGKSEKQRQCERRQK